MPLFGLNRGIFGTLVPRVILGLSLGYEIALSHLDLNVPQCVGHGKRGWVDKRSLVYVHMNLIRS